jgi:hypothetical protein
MSAGANHEASPEDSLGLSRHLTVKLKGRRETPDGAEGAQCLIARGGKPQAHHGPFQRLLGGMTGLSPKCALQEKECCGDQSN